MSELFDDATDKRSIVSPGPWSEPIDCPFYVDLDGTLFMGDSLWDSVALRMHAAPLAAWRIPLNLAKGALPAKAWLAAGGVPSARLMPYRDALVDRCRVERAAGRRVVLATAAHEGIAKPVAEYLGCFDAVIATNAVNRKGQRKLEAIQEDANGKPFIYAGDSDADLPIWREAAAAVLVGGAAHWSDAKVGTRAVERLPNEISRMRALIKAVRPHQWVKNVLVFLPLLAAHEWLDTGAVLVSLMMFLAFSLCASSVYLLNDMLDIENDRAHHRKKSRPIAAGTLPIPWAMALIPSLLLGSVAVASVAGAAAVAVLMVYYVITVAYSFSLKRLLLVDVFTLALLYVIRAIGGHAATGIAYSPWLLGFMVFLFLSLAFAKRHSELHGLKLKSSVGPLKGRGYRAEDLELVSMLGVASGFSAVVILGLYVTNDVVSRLYSHPVILWLLCPAMLFWICRVWMLSHRGQMHDDPIVFALRDKVSYGIGALALLLFLLASRFVA
ncbi:UbiA family prenyltransferase [Xanthomonas sacchari]|uniref:UbiA family prenyltransferase n=1 Tax=Xanthomonas sacchari TaxID=56458 RepID=UPI00225E4AE0|nr:UbiA family prenyltransferase [Xanthomonas sacchari]MCW0422197.1 hypothetical protein [Xanthomonas sacchari]